MTTSVSKRLDERAQKKKQEHVFPGWQLDLFTLKKITSTQRPLWGLYNSIWDYVSCVSLGYEQVTLIAWLITPPHWTTD